MKKKLRTVALTLCAIVLGAVLLCLWFVRPDPAQQKLADFVQRSEHAYQQYRSADYAEGKAVVLDHIRFLDESSSLTGNPSRKPSDVDAMLWCVRLAKLEESNSAGSGEQFMEEAIHRCEEFGWVDCSKGYLRNQIDRLDEIALAKPGR